MSEQLVDLPTCDLPVASMRNPELQTVFLITLIAVLGVSTVSPALPSIMKELAISKRQVGLLITVFTLPGVFLAPLLGVLADRYGRKRIIIPSLLLFGLAGSACALARDLSLLLGLRFLQGIGAAALSSLNVTLIGDLFSGRQRIAAMGYNASVLCIGTAVYPAIGGALAMLGWSYPFALPIFAVPVALLVMSRLNDTKPLQQQTLAVYLGGVLHGIRNLQVAVLFLASMIIFILLYGVYLMYFPLLLSERFAAVPLLIGLLMSVLSVVSAATTSQLGWLAGRMSERTIVVCGFVIFAVGLAAMAMAPTLALMALPMLLLGAAFATTIPPVQSIIAGLAPQQHRAAFMSINGMVLRLGQTIGPIMITAVYGAWGFDAVFLCGAALALVMAAIVALAVRP